MTTAGEAVMIALRVLGAIHERRIPSDADIDALKSVAPLLDDSELARKIVDEALARSQGLLARKRPSRERDGNLPRSEQKRA